MLNLCEIFVYYSECPQRCVAFSCAGMAITTRTARLDLNRALRGRVVDLYRRICRETPRIVTIYQLPFTPAEVRHIALLKFRKQMDVRDPRVIDMLIVRGEMELEETLKQWKQRAHVMNLLDMDQEHGEDPDAAVDAAEDQWWMEEVLLRCEKIAGSSHDVERLEKCLEVSRAKERGPLPGTRYVPMAIPGFREFWDEFQRRSGQTHWLDKFLTNELEDDEAWYVPGPARETIPRWLQEIRDGEARDEWHPLALAQVASQWKMSQIGWDAAGPPEQVRVPGRSEQAMRKLPIWMATRVHHPWQSPSHDPADWENESLSEEAVAELQAEVAQEYLDREGNIDKVRAIFDRKMDEVPNLAVRDEHHPAMLPGVAGAEQTIGREHKVRAVGPDPDDDRAAQAYLQDAVDTETRVDQQVRNEERSA